MNTLSLTCEPEEKTLDPEEIEILIDPGNEHHHNEQQEDETEIYEPPY